MFPSPEVGELWNSQSRCVNPGMFLPKLGRTVERQFKLALGSNTQILTIFGKTNSFSETFLPHVGVPKAQGNLVNPGGNLKRFSTRNVKFRLKVPCVKARRTPWFPIQLELLPIQPTFNCLWTKGLEIHWLMVVNVVRLVKPVPLSKLRFSFKAFFAFHENSCCPFGELNLGCRSPIKPFFQPSNPHLSVSNAFPVPLAFLRVLPLNWFGLLWSKWKTQWMV